MEKFIPYEKLSKKRKRELDARRRTVWAISPVTRKPPRSGAYDRKKAQNRRWDADGFVLFLCLRAEKRKNCRNLACICRTLALY